MDRGSVGKRIGKQALGKLDVDGSIILKWTEFIYLRI
jgi:hypothetical protein